MECPSIIINSMSFEWLPIIVIYTLFFFHMAVKCINGKGKFMILAEMGVHQFMIWWKSKSSEKGKVYCWRITPLSVICVTW